MTTKRAKKVVVYLAALLVIFTLITTCLLGNTFAKYATGTLGTAQSELSYWKVDAASGMLENNTTVKFDEDSSLSPNETGNGTDIYNSTSVMKVAAITIDASTEVDVDVYINASALTATLYSSHSYGLGIVNYGEATQEEALGVFTLHVNYLVSTTETSMPTVTINGDGSESSNYSTTGLTSGEIGNNKLLTQWDCDAVSPVAATTYIYVYAWVTWKTDYTNYGGTNLNGLSYADLLDTWIAENIESVQTTIKVWAVQGSTNPAAII